MATIKQVAAMSGVSTATVSKYLNGVTLKERNKVAVEEAIKALDFKVNLMARNLRTNKSMTVGILIPELDNVFSTQIVSNIENMLMPEGYSTIICDYKTNEELEKQKLIFLIDKMVDALVIMPYKLKAQDLENINIPIVFIDRIVKDTNFDSVLIDNKNATYLATSYLIENGHKNIGILCGPKEIYTAKERLAGYEQALMENAILKDDKNILHGEYDVAAGYELTKRLVKNELTAIMATNYELTMGAIIALNELDITIPTELSFIGFDNKDLAKAIKPSLSIVLQPVAQIGEKVAEILIDKLKNNNVNAKAIILETILIKEKSVKSIK